MPTYFPFSVASAFHNRSVGAGSESAAPRFSKHSLWRTLERAAVNFSLPFPGIRTLPAKDRPQHDKSCATLRSRFRAFCTLNRFVLALSIAFLVQDLRAQGNASVVGLVSDSSGATVPDALVTITNTGTGLQQTTKTDSGGRYNFPRLSIGNYQVDVVASGFKKVSQPGITLTAEQALTVNFAL